MPGNTRDRGGRFLPGNPGNPAAPGRPRRAVEQRYLDATVGRCPVAAWKRIVAKVDEQADAGDAKAREWLGKMLVGSDPLALADLVAELEEELRRLRYRAHHPDNGKAAADGLPGAGAAEAPPDTR